MTKLRAPKIVSVGLALAGLLGGASAGAKDIEFAADTYQKGPQGEQVGRIYVGKDRVRTEMNHQGQQVIQIVDNQQKVQWVVFPAQKNYMEQRAPATMATDQSKAAQNPCEGIPGATCRNLGVETMSGRKVTKWEMSVQQQGQTQKVVQWLDEERGMPLKVEADGGQKMELTFVAHENMDGRPVEHWRMTTTQADQSSSVANQWYDPQLELTVREELGGGFLREMRNIKVGPQPESLFAVPAGFQKVDPQQQGQGR